MKSTEEPAYRGQGLLGRRMASANMQAHRTARRMWELEAASYQKVMWDNYEAGCARILRRKIWYVSYPKDIEFYLTMTGKPLKGF